MVVDVTTDQRGLDRLAGDGGARRRRVESLAGEARPEQRAKRHALPRKREPPAQSVADVDQDEREPHDEQHAPRQACERVDDRLRSDADQEQAEQRDTAPHQDHTQAIHGTLPSAGAARAPACGACPGWRRTKTRQEFGRVVTRGRGGGRAARRVDRGDRGRDSVDFEHLDAGDGDPARPVNGGCRRGRHRRVVEDRINRVVEVVVVPVAASPRRIRRIDVGEHRRQALAASRA